MLYRELIPPQIHVLDLMPLWVSHLPKDASYEHVSGLVMNEQEFASNPQLDDYFALNLNKRPKISMRGEIFDFVVNSASVQYLTRLGQVFASASRMLRLSGRSIVDYSHSRFPTKAVAIWQQLSRDNRARLGSSYHVISGSFDESFFLDRSPENAAPLWVVIARKATHSNLPIFTQPRPTRKFLSAREIFCHHPPLYLSERRRRLHQTDNERSMFWEGILNWPQRSARPQQKLRNRQPSLCSSPAETNPRVWLDANARNRPSARRWPVSCIRVQQRA